MFTRKSSTSKFFDGVGAVLNAVGNGVIENDLRQRTQKLTISNMEAGLNLGEAQKAAEFAVALYAKRVYGRR